MNDLAELMTTIGIVMHPAQFGYGLVLGLVAALVGREFFKTYSKLHYFSGVAVALAMSVLVASEGRQFLEFMSMPTKMACAAFFSSPILALVHAVWAAILAKAGPIADAIVSAISGGKIK